MAKSKLGQNFLRDTAAIERIVAALGDVSQRTVVEIGPGQGAITGPLAARTGRLIAVEFDPALAAAIEDRYRGQTQVEIVRGDVLEFDFAAAAAEAGERLVVVGNLPYYITSPILLRLAACAAAVERAVLMVQREVAERVTAEPGSRDYGLLSVTVQMHGPTTSLFTLPPIAFSPPPEVHSSVFRWSFAPRFAELGVEEPEMQALVKAAFAQKRKTLGNNLRAAGYPAEALEAAFAEAGVKATDRAEAVGIAGFAALARALREK